MLESDSARLFSSANASPSINDFQQFWKIHTQQFMSRSYGNIYTGKLVFKVGLRTYINRFYVYGIPIVRFTSSELLSIHTKHE